MATVENKSYFSICLLSLISILLVVVGCAKVRYAKPLMPTPLNLVLGLPHPASVLQADTLSPDVNVFVVSGRNVESEDNLLDPFGTDRNSQPVFSVATVDVGTGLSSAQILAETLTPRKRKRAKVTLTGVRLDSTNQSQPWLLKDSVSRHHNCAWIQAIRRRLDSSRSRSICIYVHGYNTSFVDNTLLAAEIYHYLGREGAMISFEWPSEAKLLGYIADKGNAMFSTRHFRNLLANLAKEVDANSITIIGHSAGAPIVVNALRELRLLEHDSTVAEVQNKYRIGRVVLAAPDMDLSSFVNAVYDRFHEMTQGVAVYASPSDKALKVSQLIYKNDRLGRAVGQLEEWESTAIAAARKIQMIDVSEPSRQHRKYLKFAEHSYFHRDPWISSDIGSFLLGATPVQRGLNRKRDDIFWEFSRDYEQRLRGEHGQRCGLGATLRMHLAP